MDKDILQRYSIIADGGVKNLSCIAKCIALGASFVMMGGIFAAIDESPSLIEEMKNITIEVNPVLQMLNMIYCLINYQNWKT